MKPTMAHRFEAETLQSAEAFYSRWVDENGLNGLPHPDGSPESP